MWVATRERFVCIVPQFDSTSRSTNMPRANRRQQTEMERWRARHSGPQTAQTHCDAAQHCTKVHCSLCCHCCTVALTLCTIANRKSQLARPNQAVNVLLLLSLSETLVLFCLSCVFWPLRKHIQHLASIAAPLICHILHVEVVWELRLGPKFACQIPFKYSKCHRVAPAFVVGNDFVTAISICLTVCLALRLLSCCYSCCCQEVVPGCPAPPFLCWLATICLLLLLPCITLCL